MDSKTDQPNIWAAAADILSGAAAVLDAATNPGVALLVRLGFLQDGAADASGHRVKLLRFAARMADVFEIAAPDAPGLVFVAGMTRPSLHRSRPLRDETLSAGGRGIRFGDAFVACVGEAIERVAQYQAEDDRLERRSVAAGLAGYSSGSAEAMLELLEDRAGAPDAEIDWLPAQNLARGGAVLAPADLCLFRPAAPAVLSTNPSIGCASGATCEDAILSGLLELIERDAAALWWHAGRPARAIAMETLEQAGVLALLQNLRQGRTTRRSWFLDITSDLGVPCVAAVSFLAEGGGFAHGIAARPTLGAAAAVAMYEMCQMEVAYHLIALKLATSGEEKLSPADRRHRQRFASIDPDRHPFLLPRLGPSLSPLADQPADDLRALAQGLETKGFECFAVDLTRPEIGVPVFKVLVPGLQPLPSDVRSKRLQQAASLVENPCQTDVPLF